MLAFIVFPGEQLAALDFGSPPERALTPEEHVREILQDYAARKGELLDYGSGSAVEILSRILESAGDKPAAMVLPIRALGFLGRPQGFEIVARHLHIPDPNVRLTVIHSLGQMGHFDAIPLLEPFLRSLNREERREAIIALGKFGEPDQIPKIEAATSGDPRLSKLASEARARIMATAMGFRTTRYDDLADAVIDSAEYEDLIGLIIVTRLRLLEILSGRSREPKTRERAMRVLALARIKRAGLHIREILADLKEPFDLRLCAVWALGLTRTRSAVPQLVALLADSEPAMREASILALGRIGDPRALEPLLACWEAADAARRSRLQLASYRLRTTPGVDALLEPLKTYQPREIADVVFVSDSLQLSRGYQAAAIAPYLDSSPTEARRDALLLLATFGTKADSARLHTASKTDADPVNREIARLGVERLKDIPIWERA